MDGARPLTLLIAALGGEGGGVLADWIVAAATGQGLHVQSTSIPGVAQRTGATTYYIEMLAPQVDAARRRPVLALMPGIGDVDVLMASELLEADRAVANGFVTQDRTLVIASTHRVFAMTEKTGMGDSRVEPERLIKALESHARRSLLLDMEKIAKASGAMLNSVMLGVLAGSAALPIPAAAFEAAIRGDGKAVESNIRGFQAGLAAAADGREGASPARAKAEDRSAPSLAALEQDAAAMPEAAREVILEGVRRLADYQDLAYARLYLDRLAPIRVADERARAGGALLRETARHLALRMSFEDVIRVAAAKTAPARFRRIREELGAKPDEPVAVIDFLKPGIEEICSLLPPRLARPILGYSARRGWLDKAYWGMEVKSSSVSGYFRFWLLAKLRRWRRASHRYREEQAAIEAWLKLVAEAAPLAPELALEIAECAGLIKGYGETHRRGSANYREIERRLIRPALRGLYRPSVATDAIASARAAALADPDGRALARCFAEIERQEPLRAMAE